MSAKEEVVGAKPAWELWMESVRAQETRGAELVRLGCFTVLDLQKKMGWNRERAQGWLRRNPVKSELAYDERSQRKMRFYFPPKSK